MENKNWPEEKNFQVMKKIILKSNFFLYIYRKNRKHGFVKKNRRN